MKIASLVVSVVMMIAIAAASFGAEPASSTLDEATRMISEALRDADKVLSDTARRVGRGLGADSNMRADIQRLCKERAYAIDCSFVNAKGVVEIMEPEKYRKYEGSNLSAQGVTAGMLRNRRPIFSELYIGIEELQAALLGYPVLNAKNDFVGSVNLFFSPEVFIRQTLKGLKTGKGVVILVIQADGTHVFSSDPAQTRRNVLQSPEYQAFSELKGLVGQIVSKEEGVGPYRYIKPGTHQVVKKRAFWKTVSLYDGFWRVVVTEPEKP